MYLYFKLFIFLQVVSCSRRDDGDESVSGSLEEKLVNFGVFGSTGSHPHRYSLSAVIPSHHTVVLYSHVVRMLFSTNSLNMWVIAGHLTGLLLYLHH